MRPVTKPLSKGTEMMTEHTPRGLCTRLFEDYDFICTITEVEYALTYMPGQIGKVMRYTYRDGLSFLEVAELVKLSYKRTMEVVHIGLILCIRYIKLYREKKFADADFLDRDLMYIFDYTVEGVLRDAGFNTPRDLFIFLEGGGDLFQFRRIGARFIEKINDILSENGFPLNDYFIFPVKKNPREDFARFVSDHKDECRSLTILHKRYAQFKASRIPCR